MPLTLLLADADSAMHRFVARTCAAEDMTIVSVSDGEQAIYRIATEPPDIILADIGLPLRSGYDIAAFVRERAALAQIPVVLLAGALDRVDEARAAAARCNGVLVKPFEPHQLIARVRQLVTEGKEPARNPLGDYFNQLDAAFGSLDASPAAGLHPASASDGDDETAEVEVPTMKSVLGELRRDEPRTADVRRSATAAAFEALMAADKAVRLTAPASPVAQLAITEELVDRVATRVIARLAPEGTTDLVARIVSEVAERLVRDEIDRIRGRK